MAVYETENEHGSLARGAEPDRTTEQAAQTAQQDGNVFLTRE
ncbi:hypothetical protein GCM10010359_57330 [Streptomyces morookaense]|nr:hypothetical protein GCM10010359_57330 [Streptomyces morookaense]